MILIDTSAWVEFFRGTDSPVCGRVEALLSEETAVCDPVRMELLAGVRSERQLRDLRALLARSTHLTTTPSHYEDAAQIHRTCRARGETVRKLIDCLIAAHAISADVAVLHCDADFEVIERFTSLRVLR